MYGSSVSSIVRDKNSDPIPQFLDQGSTHFAPLQGISSLGAAFNLIKDELGTSMVLSSDGYTMTELQTSTKIAGQFKLTDGNDNLAISSLGNAQVEVQGNLPSGSNTIGKLNIESSGGNLLNVSSLGNAQVEVQGSLPAGTNNIGDVDIASAIPTGTNTIGKVKLTDGTTEVDISSDGYIRTNEILSDTLNHGMKAVTTAGTAVQLSSQACREVTVIAEIDNTGYIYAGGTTVSDSSYGVKLDAGDAYTFDRISDVSLIYLDADNNGDGVSYIYV